MSKVNHRRRLAGLALERQTAQQALRTVEGRLRKAVIAADEAKAMSRREMALIARCSPQSIYNWVGESE